MEQNTVSEVETVDVNSLKTILAAQVDENGLLADDAWFKIEVSYKPKRGNSDRLGRSGDVWAFDAGEYSDKIRFSLAAGTDQEESMFIKIRGQTAEVFSVDDYGDSHKLGRVKEIRIKD